jgi:hypothetical protein
VMQKKTIKQMLPPIQPNQLIADGSASTPRPTMTVVRCPQPANHEPVWCAYKRFMFQL